VAKYEQLIKNNPNNVQAYLSVTNLYRTQAADATDPKIVAEIQQKAINTMNELKKCSQTMPWLSEPGYHLPVSEQVQRSRKQCHPGFSKRSHPIFALRYLEPLAKTKEQLNTTALRARTESR
jgi:hypothetical protein